MNKTPTNPPYYPSINRSLILQLLLLFTGATAFSQEWQIFQSRETVYDIQVDGDLVWCATEGGSASVSLADYEVRVYNSLNSSLRNPLVSHVSLGQEGELLLSDGWLHTFDGQEWQRMDMLPPASENNDVTAMSRKKFGRTLVGFYQGEIVSYQDGNLAFEQQYCHEYFEGFEIVTCLVQDTDSSFWASGQLGVCRYEGDEIIQYTQQNSGLANSVVKSMDVDSEGVMWFGTQNGLSSFDGQQWNSYSLTPLGLFSNKINKVFVASDDRIWVGTEGGMAVFDRTDWQIYTTANSPLASDYVLAFAETDSGVICIGAAQGGLHLVYPDQWKVISLSDAEMTSNRIEAIIPLPDNQVGIASGDRFIRFDGNEWNHFTAPGFGPWPNYIYDAVTDNDGRVWLLLFNGLARIEDDTYSFFDHLNNQGFFDYLPNSMALTSKQTNRIWFGTFDKGIFSFDGQTWEHFTSNNSPLLTDEVIAVSMDSQGNIWVGCGSSGGFFKIENGIWHHYTNQNTDLPYHSGNWVFNIYIDDEDKKYLGSYGLGIFDDPFSEWTLYLPDNSDIPSQMVSAVIKDGSDRIWVATYAGIGMLDGEEWHYYNQMNSPLMDDWITCLMEDHEGNFWIGTYRSGLYKLSLDPVSVKTPPPSPPLRLFPNPAKGEVFLELQEDFTGPIQLKLFDLNGRIVHEARIETAADPLSISVRDLSAGMYFLQASSRDRLETVKVVKEN
jgi:ligand-binding sensor domain-containing protein